MSIYTKAAQQWDLLPPRPKAPPVVPPGIASNAVFMPAYDTAYCTCGVLGNGFPYGFQPIHVAGCNALTALANKLVASCANEKEKPAKIVIAGHTKWNPPASIPMTGGIKHPKAAHRTPDAKPYRFILQFYFTRPVDYDLWKKIKAPRGWRKGPVKKEAMNTWCGVRFICTKLKYALTPEEVETLHATLQFCLKEVY